MFSKTDRVVEALARLTCQEEPRPTDAPPPLAIAVSRSAGSGGSEVARAVGARLGWPVYDHELLTRVAQEKGLNQALLERLDERPVGWIEELMDSFSDVPTATEAGYVRALVEVMNRLGRSGNCVIVGRGAAKALPVETTLRVRIVAPRQACVAAVAKKMGLTQEQAARWVDKTDHERAQFVWRHFLGDVADPAGYDLILNSARFGLDECASIIAEAARGRTTHPTGQGRTFQMASA
ncbi:MAG: cytidylate kinase-like family protein [Gemmataceae bacterium]